MWEMLDLAVLADAVETPMGGSGRKKKRDKRKGVYKRGGSLVGSLRYS